MGFKLQLPLLDGYPVFTLGLGTRCLESLLGSEMIALMGAVVVFELFEGGGLKLIGIDPFGSVAADKYFEVAIVKYTFHVFVDYLYYFEVLSSQSLAHALVERFVERTQVFGHDDIELSKERVRLEKVSSDRE